MEISSTADWQDSLLAFHKLDLAFENDRCRNSDTDFQRDGKSMQKKATRCLVEQDQRRIGNKEIVNENFLVPKRELNCCSTATPCLAYFLESRIVDHA